MRADALALLVALIALAPVLAAAEENNDLDRIPPSLQDNAPSETPPASAAPPSPAHGKYYVEDAFVLSSLRGGLAVPLPPPKPADWRNRTSLDATGQWNFGQGISLSLSDRFNLLEENDFAYPSRQMVRNDFREGYVTWRPAAQNYLEAGRINLRNGVALGFNPTDFFKTRTQVDLASLDPSVIREDRLGVLMLRGQSIWNSGAASIAFAPKLYAPTPVATRPQPGISPMLDRTNAADRFLLSANYDLADLSPQALVYREAGATKLGLDISHPIGQAVIAYAEWAGGRQRNLISEAESYGRKTGTLPPVAPLLPPSNTTKSFRSDAALGASWTSAAKLTLNLEYHYHQAGLSGADERRWFAIGQAQRNFLPVTGELWFVRGYANDQQQPWTRQQIFLRADWTDAFVTDLEFTAFSYVNLYDGSSLSQVSASYYLSNHWTIGAYLSANLGAPRSERGSVAQAGSAVLQLIRYF